MEGFGEPSGQVDAGFDVDGAMSAIESGGSFDGGSNESEAVSNTQSGVEDALSNDAAKAEAQAAAVAELEFNHNGKPVKVPFNDPRVTQWASQGYDYAQKMAAFKAQQQEAESQYAQYKPIDEYVRQNPAFWDHVTQSWEQKQNEVNGVQLDPNDPIQKQILELKEQLKPVSQLMKDQEQQRAQQVIEQEDQALDGEIQSIREKYKDLDWDTPDTAGESLEIRVLKHAGEIGTKSFQAAMRDLLHDDLVKKAEERGKEQVTKDIQAKRKQGLLGTTPTPTKGITDAKHIKSQSYDQLLNEALQELQGA
jgi:hypothetical protein